MLCGSRKGDTDEGGLVAGQTHTHTLHSGFWTVIVCGVLVLEALTCCVGSNRGGGDGIR